VTPGAVARARIRAISASRLERWPLLEEEGRSVWERDCGEGGVRASDLRAVGFSSIEVAILGGW